MNSLRRRFLKCMTIYKKTILSNEVPSLSQKIFLHEKTKAMVKGSVSRLIFLDSSVNTHHDRTKAFLPSQAFRAHGEEKFSLTLLQFAIRRNWYNINSTNNTFFINIDSTLHSVVIEPGVYSTFSSLVTGINSALTTAVAGIADITSIIVTYDTSKRFFTFTVQMEDGSFDKDVSFKCFSIKDGVLPVTVSPNAGFNDSYEILGALPVKEASSAVDSLFRESKDTAAGEQVFKSNYPASLNTLDAIYLHLVALEMGNYCSTGFNFQVIDDPRVIESSLFARIPFDSSGFDEVHEVVQYVDSGMDIAKIWSSWRSVSLTQKAVRSPNWTRRKPTLAR